MYDKYFRFLAAVTLVFVVSTGAASAKKKAQASFRLLEATSQRTLPGIPGAAVKTEYHFTVVWQDRNPPAEVYWDGEDGRLVCTVTRVHKMTKKDERGIKVTEYLAGKDMTTPVHKGDTLDFRAYASRKIEKPAGVPDVKNSLDYKAGNGGWMHFTIKTITRKPDIALP